MRVLCAQVLAASTMQDLPAGGIDWVLALPTIVANMHDYFVATAAKLEKTHREVRMIASYLVGLCVLHHARLARARSSVISIGSSRQTPYWTHPPHQHSVDGCC